MTLLPNRTRARAAFVSRGQEKRVLAYLRRQPRHNLLLLEILEGRGDGNTANAESVPEVIAAWDGDEILGVASLRPSVVIDGGMTPEGMEACLPILWNLGSGLIKTRADRVAPLWKSLRARGRTSLLDRFETCYVLPAEEMKSDLPDSSPGSFMRVGGEADLADLAEAARASLREEGRPDPLLADPEGFRRWVRSRIQRARLLIWEGRPVFVGYADVRRPEGWLIQGVYTWPGARRRGHARAGMAALAREAQAEGTEHVQLAVVEGNQPAIGLYEGLGFKPLARLRTILFS